MVENAIRERREELGVTQQWLSEHARVPQNTISEIENGAEAKVLTAIRIARALNTTVENLWSKNF